VADEVYPDQPTAAWSPRPVHRGRTPWARPRDPARTCWACGRRDGSEGSGSWIEVHHLLPSYLRRGRPPGDGPGEQDDPTTLLELCQRCHREAHKLYRMMGLEDPSAKERMRAGARRALENRRFSGRTGKAERATLRGRACMMPAYAVTLAVKYGKASPLPGFMPWPLPRARPGGIVNYNGEWFRL
jgi:hypothetical protein